MHAWPFYSYLFFSGNCTRGVHALPGDLRRRTPADTPMSDVPAGRGTRRIPPAADLIMHASLTNGDDLLMRVPTTRRVTPAVPSASRSTSRRPTPRGPAKCSTSCPTVARSGRRWPETFFSPAFGMCVDRFGIPWMVSADPPT